MYCSAISITSEGASNIDIPQSSYFAAIEGSNKTLQLVISSSSTLSTLYPTPVVPYM